MFSTIMFLLCAFPGQTTIHKPAIDERPSVAILDLRAKGGIEQATVDALADLVATGVMGIGSYRVIARSDIHSLIGFEQIKDRLGCEDTNCLAEIGGALGVTYILTGNVAGMGTVYLLNFSLIDPAKTAVVNRSSHKIEGNQAALIDAIPAALAVLFKLQNGAVQPLATLDPKTMPLGDPLSGQAPPDLRAAEQLLKTDLSGMYTHYRTSLQFRNGMNFHDYLHEYWSNRRKSARNQTIVGAVITGVTALLIGTGIPMYRNENNDGIHAFGIVNITLGAIFGTTGLIALLGGPVNANRANATLTLLDGAK